MYFTKWYRVVFLFLICLAYSIYKYYNKVKKEKQLEERRQTFNTSPDEMSKSKADVLSKKPDLASKDRPLYYKVLIYGVLKPLLYSALVYILDLWWYTMQWYQNIMDNLALTGLISWGFFLPLLTIPFISQYLVPK